MNAAVAYFKKLDFTRHGSIEWEGDLLNALAAARQLLVATFLDTFTVGAYLWRPLQGLSVGMRHFVRFPLGGAWSDSGIRCVE